MTEQMAQTTATIASLHARAEGSVDRHQRSIEWLTQAIGRPRSVYVIALLVVAWVLANAAAPHVFGRAPDPPPFFWLQGLVSLAALMVSTMVLTTQNRHRHHAQQRASLDLEVNLMAEQKIAKLIALMEELRRDLPGVRNRVDEEANEMINALDPHAVLTALEDGLQQPRTDRASGSA